MPGPKKLQGMRRKPGGKSKGAGGRRRVKRKRPETGLQKLTPQLRALVEEAMKSFFSPSNGPVFFKTATRGKGKISVEYEIEALLVKLVTVPGLDFRRFKKFIVKASKGGRFRNKIETEILNDINEALRAQKTGIAHAAKGKQPILPGFEDPAKTRERPILAAGGRTEAHEQKLQGALTKFASWLKYTEDVKPRVKAYRMEAAIGHRIPRT